MEHSNKQADEAWQILSSKPLLKDPYISVDVQQVQLPDGRKIDGWTHVDARDYTNVLVLNEQNEALVMTGYKHGIGRSSWQMVGGYLEGDEDPLLGAQRELMEETGFEANNWLHLGSYTIDANRHIGVGHLFLAQKLEQVTSPNNDDLEAYEIEWIPLKVLQYGLWDGRLAGMSYALTVSLGSLALQQSKTTPPLFQSVIDEK